MSVYDIGRVCKKILGREAGKYCVIVDVIDKNYLLVDGITIKRRRVNKNHIKLKDSQINIEKGAPHDVVLSAIKKSKLEKKLTSVKEIKKSNILTNKIKTKKREESR